MTGTDRRTRLLPDERRAQLIATGVAMLADHPLDELTVETVSKRAGVSKGLMFYYFGSKQGFHRDVIRTARDSMLHATEPAPERPPAERLSSVLTRTVRFARDHESTFYSLVRGTASGDPEVREVLDEAREHQAERVRALFRELGMHDSELLRIALRSWVAFVEQTLIDAGLRTELPDEEIAAFLSRTLLSIVAEVDPANDQVLRELAVAAESVRP